MKILHFCPCCKQWFDSPSVHMVTVICTYPVQFGGEEPWRTKQRNDDREFFGLPRGPEDPLGQVEL